LIADAHCHVSPHWYEPVESLLFHMDRNGVERAVLIQHMGQFDNEYLFDCVRRFSLRFAPVVLVDTSAPQALDELDRLVERGAKGLRLAATARSPGDDPLAIWRRAAALRLPVSCLGQAKQFASDAFADLVRAFPDLSIVIEHLGGSNAPSDDTAHLDLRRKVFALSKLPNTYIKFHGLGEFCSRAMPVSQPFPFEWPIPPLLEMAY